jgi:signal transduction histidine kinase
MDFPVFEPLILALAVAADLAIATYVLSKNPRNIVNQAFFIFVTGAALWGLGVLLLSLTQNFNFSDMVFFGGAIGSFGLLLLARTFPSTSHIPRKFWLHSLPFLAIIVAAPFGVFVRGMVIRPDGSLHPILGPAFPSFLFIITVYILLSLFLLARNYLRLGGPTHLQMQYLFAGATIFALFAVISDAILPAFGIFNLNLLGPASSILFAGFTAYAIVRHQLMDIRVVIQRGAIYSALLALIVGFYLAAIFVLETIFRKATNISVLISAGLTTVIGIFGVPYLERYFRRLTDKVFFKGKYEYPEATYILSEILNRNLELDGLSAKATQALKQIFRVGKVSLLLIPQNVFLNEEGEWQTAGKHYSREFISELERNPEVLLCSEITRGQVNTIAGNERREISLEIQKLHERCGAEVIVPLALEHRLVGILTMGKKLSGDSYTGDDVKLLKTFSCQAAVALEKAELYKRVQDYSRELEARVKQRTAEIQQLQEEQRQMMVDLSHGLQTPLTIIKGNLDFLKNQMPTNKRIDALHNATDRVSEFIYDLLKLAKLESSQDDFKKEPVDFSKLLRDIVEYVGVIAQEKQIGVVSHIEPSLKICGQKDKLEELVANLISNAVKYTPDGGKIYIDLKKIDGIIVELAIRDTGIGIDKEDLPHIFERFYKIGNQGREHVRGTGLGLAICKRIVEKHGGTIEARSEFGKGTIFTVRFPLALQT